MSNTVSVRQNEMDTARSRAPRLAWQTPCRRETKPSKAEESFWREGAVFIKSGSSGDSAATFTSLARSLSKEGLPWFGSDRSLDSPVMHQGLPHLRRTPSPAPPAPSEEQSGAAVAAGTACPSAAGTARRVCERGLAHHHQFRCLTATAASSLAERCYLLLSPHPLCRALFCLDAWGYFHP